MDEDSEKGLGICYISSWNLHEFLGAVEHDKISTHYCRNLDADLDSAQAQDWSSAVKSKFFAGSCHGARFM